jgi:hypothetical protein
METAVYLNPLWVTCSIPSTQHNNLMIAVNFLVWIVYRLSADHREGKDQKVFF